MFKRLESLLVNLPDTESDDRSSIASDMKFKRLAFRIAR